MGQNLNQTVYIKPEKNKAVKDDYASVGSIAEVFCEDASVAAKVRSLRVIHLREEKRYIISVMDIVKVITATYPGIAVENLGEMDIVVEHIGNKKSSATAVFVKCMAVCIITFFGAAFAIMAYNNDINSMDLLSRIYEIVLGEGADGHYVLEISYSLGLFIGIVVFYGHFGAVKLMKDPTPLEVEMYLYDDDVNTAVIKLDSAEKKENYDSGNKRKGDMCIANKNGEMRNGK